MTLMDRHLFGNLKIKLISFFIVSIFLKNSMTLTYLHQKIYKINFLRFKEFALILK
jgi:hypothetical protein